MNCWKEQSCSEWVPACTGATRGAMGYHCPMLPWRCVNREHLLPWLALLCVISPKTNKKTTKKNPPFWIFRARFISVHSLDCRKSLGINAMEKLGKGTYVKHCSTMGRLLPHHPGLLKDNLVTMFLCRMYVCFLVTNSSMGLHLLALRGLWAEIPHFLKKYFWFEVLFLDILN